MYGNVPVALKGWVKDWPMDRNGLFQPLPLNMPFWPDVLVCGVPSSLIHLTLSPTRTVRFASAELAMCEVIVLDAGVAVGTGVAVAVAVGVGVAVG